MSVGIEVSNPASSAGDMTGSRLRIDSLILQSRGWSSQATDCTPKMAALASLVNLGPPDAVAKISYQSRGNLLIVASASSQRARLCADRLAQDLHVTLIDSQLAEGDVPFMSWTGHVDALGGHLGEFTATISGLQAPGAAAAANPIPARFDLVLDFSTEPLLAMRQPPPGYYRAPASDAALEAVLAELRESIGEFEKPKYFAYRENICAHSRSHVTGCNACIEICSTQAISPDGDHVKVDPHLCMGCGACATVCPSGAMSYQFPRVPDRGAQLKQLLTVYLATGGNDACIVFHNGAQGRELLCEAAATERGLPARALPLETLHVAAIGLDLLLPAIAFGASQVVIVAAGAEDPLYLEALREQMAIGETILGALGYGGEHFRVIEARDPASLANAFEALDLGVQGPPPATFMLSGDKRTAIEFAVEHLVRHAPRKVDEIALPPGSPFGEILVDKVKCTMCLACVGACPESALMDGVDQPLLKFLERNCVQCGLCENTCPEGAISLSARLLLTPAVREPRVVNETQPFHCVSCNKPFGTKLMIDAMLARLTGHSMFAGGAALRRLQMCADCRVVDMMAAKNETSILDLGANPR
jgi:ferredoxin